MNGGRRRSSARLTIAFVLAATFASGCGIKPHPNRKLAGTWVGFYRWVGGETYPVTLVVPPETITDSTPIRFKATEAAGGCDRVEVEGVFDVASAQVVLDEVSTDCEGFLLDGRYDGHLSADGATMDFSWGLDTDENDVPPISGVLHLSKSGRASST